MTRKKVTLEIKGEEFSLEAFTDEEKENLQTFLEEDPLLLHLYILRELVTITKRLGLPQWTQKYEYKLDVGKTNHLIDQFPTRGAKYLYVKEATGTVTLKFDSQNEPSFILTTKDQYRMPFTSLYLSWTAQATKELVFYVSNKEILRSTLA